MEKRVFLAIFLSFVVLAVYQAFLAPPKPDPAAVVAGATANAAPASTAGAAAAQAPLPAPAPATPASPAATPLVADAAARDIVVETDAIRAVFSTAGATLRSWKLKTQLENGQPLELVPGDLGDAYTRPFTIATNDEAMSRTLASALFKPSADSLTLGSNPGTLSFEYRDASGLSARKTFYIQPDHKPYVVRVEASIDLGGALRPVTIASGPSIGMGFPPDSSRTLPARGVQFTEGKVHYLAADAIAKQADYSGELRFAGVEDQYFLMAALPGTERVQVKYANINVPIPGDADNRHRTFVGYTVAVPGALNLPFFLGPKDFDVLRAVDPQLVMSIDFGWFRLIVTPLLIALKSINGVVHNWGWSIVVLTVIINLLIFPLRHRSMVSMKKMQAVQPEVKAIQDRYAKYKVTDPERQKMNQEMMALYKSKGVNPASGCLPMLLTLPILFAFYSMLAGAIELRGAPFFGWIHDLAKHDPYYITPVLMGLTMLWQQKTMPTTADPIQQKMFLLMPVIFTVSFLWAPAGLVVYWFVSNLLAIGQQYLTNRIVAAPARPARAIAKK
jgi:YidC/Oxa1 family membrane protein insertase